MLCLEAHLKVDFGSITFGEPIKLHDEAASQSLPLALLFFGAQFSPDAARARLAYFAFVLEGISSSFMPD